MHFENMDEPPPRPNLWPRFLDAAVIIVLFLALLIWMQYRDLKAEVETHKHEAKRVTSMLAQCMNGKALYDRQHEIAYFCGKVIEVKL